MPIDISVIIVNFKAQWLVRECIKGLKRLDSRLALEIIVVDNSCDSSLETVLKERFPDVKYIQMRKNAGFSRANNVGIQNARGTYILILNYDITPLPGSIDTLYAYMEAHPYVGIVGPKLLNPDGTTQDSFYRFHSLITPFLRRTWFGNAWKGKRHIDYFLMRDRTMDKPTDVDWLLGACLLARASFIDTVGLLDERFFLYFEDTDWCRRFWRAGYKVRYIPESRMIHLHKRDSAQSRLFSALFNKVTRVHIASWFKYIHKWSHYGRNAK